MNLEAAAQAAKNGAYAAFISGGITLAVFAIAIATDAQGGLALWNDPAIIVDIVIIAFCGIGMYRKSRAAAIVMTVYFLFAKIYIVLETGRFNGMILSLVFLYFFVKAVEGTFVYHRIRKSEDPEYRAAPRWYAYVGIPVVTLALLLMGFGLLSMTTLMPSTEVVAGNAISESDRQALVENNVLYEDEKIELFYSNGLFTVLSEGNILTDRAVVTYYTDENGIIAAYEIPYTEFVSVELEDAGGWAADAIYRVNGTNDSWVTLYLSVENQGDVRFVEALRRNAERVQAEREPSQD